jgi:hypothetical protein
VLPRVLLASCRRNTKGFVVVFRSPHLETRPLEHTPHRFVFKQTNLSAEDKLLVWLVDLAFAANIQSYF